jgi:hypothetical protein
MGSFILRWLIPAIGAWFVVDQTAPVLKKAGQSLVDEVPPQADLPAPTGPVPTPGAALAPEGAKTVAQVPKVPPGQAADARHQATGPAGSTQGQSVTVPVDPAAKLAWFRAELQKRLAMFGANRGPVVEIVQQDPTLFMSQRGLDEMTAVMRYDDVADARQSAETARRYASYYRMTESPDTWYSWAAPSWNRYGPFELYARYKDFSYNDTLRWRMAELQQRLREARRNCDPTRYNCGF